MEISTTSQLLDKSDIGLLAITDDRTITQHNQTITSIFQTTTETLTTLNEIPIGNTLYKLAFTNSFVSTPEDGCETKVTETSNYEYIVEIKDSATELCITTGDYSEWYQVQWEWENNGETAIFTFENITQERDGASLYKRAMTYTADLVGVIKQCGTPITIDSRTHTNIGNVYHLNTNAEDDVNNVLQATHEDDISKIKRSVENCIDGDTIKIKARLQTEETDSYRVFELTFRPTSATNQIDQPIFTARDITKQHSFKKRRKVMNRVLRHDLRNDMNVVMGHAEIILQSKDEYIQKQAQVIKEKSENLVELGNKVRKIDQDLHGVNRQLRQVNLSRVVSEVVEDFHKDQPGVTIRTALSNQFVVGHSLLRTAIENVLENAVEHNTHPRGDIDISISTEYDADSEYVKLRVSDNGPGIPEGEKHVLETGIETELDHVSGLGLWLVKWVTEGIDGELEINENENGGAEIVFNLVPSSITPDEKQENEVDPIEPEQANVFNEDFDALLESGSDPITTTTRGE